MSSQGKQFYSDEEAEEILRLAVRKSSNVGGVTRDNLLQSAAELGVSAEALAEAENQVMERQLEKSDRDEFKRRQRERYVADVWQAIVTSAILAGINLWTSETLSWCLIVIGILAIKLVLEFAEHMIPATASYQQEFRKWQDRNRKRVVRQEPTQTEVLDRLVLENERLYKLEAIKLLREETGLGLKEAKDEVDRYAATRPDVFA